MNMLLIFSFIYGAVIGSFLNVVLYRFGTCYTIGGRSMCTSCGKKLKAPELIPIVSYLFLRGKCRDCKSAISLQYPVIELASGCIAVLVVLASGLLYFNSPYQYVGWIFGTSAIHLILLAILVYDLRHKIIPDTFSALFAGISLALLFSGLHTISGESLLTVLAAGPILALPFALLWLVSRGAWIGFGDAKLALGIGWYVGLSHGIAALLIAIWIGALVGIVLITYSRIKTASAPASSRIKMNTEIPFAPFLVVGVWIVAFLGISFADILSFFEVLLSV